MGCGGLHQGKAHFTPKPESKTQASKEMRPTYTCSPCGPWLAPGQGRGPWVAAGLLSVTFDLADREV